MKKIFTLLIAISLLLTLAACTTEKLVPYEVKIIEYVDVPGPIVYVDRVETVIEEKVIYEEIKYVEVQVIEYIPRELTNEELDNIKIPIRSELQKVFDVDLEKAKEDLEPVTIIEEKIVKEPIASDDYEHYYTLCVIKRPGKEPLTLRNLLLEYTLVGKINGNYTITLDKPNDDGVTTWSLDDAEDNNSYVCTYDSKDNGFINN
jgi:hypothetical protein